MQPVAVTAEAAAVTVVVTAEAAVTVAGVAGVEVAGADCREGTSTQPHTNDNAQDSSTHLLFNCCVRALLHATPRHAAHEQTHCSQDIST